MEQDAAGTADRRVQAVPPLPREDTDAALPSRAAVAPEVRALLAELDDLRLLLSTDLELAASAVDAGALDVARDVLAGAQDDLAVFEVRAGHALREPAGVVPLPGPASRRRRHRLSILAPALTAAAALVGVLLGVLPSTAPPASPDQSVATNAAASYAELWRLHEQGAPAARLARAARQLHAEVGRLVAAGAPPAAVTEALRLLELQRRVLSDPQHRDALSAELAESQRLVAALRGAALSSPAGTLLADAPVADVAPHPTARPSTSTTGGQAPTAPDVVPATAPAPTLAPEQQQPADRPRPAAAPTPAPDSGPSADDTQPDRPQQPARSQEPAPSQEPADPPPSGSTSTGSAADSSTPAEPDQPDTVQPPAPEPVLTPRTSGTLLPE